jgi:hypothetical protein
MTRIILFWSSAVFRVFPRPSAALNFRGLKSAAATDVEFGTDALGRGVRGLNGRRVRGHTHLSSAFFPRPSAARQKNLPRPEMVTSAVRSA